MADTENTVNLVAREWKHTLETIPTESILSLVSIWDLLFDTSTNDPWSDKADSSSGYVGAKLDHDIICFYKNMVSSSGAIDTDAGLENSKWWTYGIDISIPRYDGRAKAKKIDFANNVTSSYIGSNRYCYIYDKDAALPPSSIEQFTKYGVKAVSFDSTTSLSNNTYCPPSLGIFSDNSSVGSNIDIYLCNQDTGFSSTLLTQEGYSAYNRIFINSQSPYAAVLICKLLGLNDSSFKNQGSDISLTGTITNEFYKSLSNIFGGDSNLKNVLKNTFVWVRAPFFADYIIPESFNQDLNQDSKVIHSELMLSGSGDFNRYDTHLSASIKASTDGSLSYINTDLTYSSDNSLPYIPRTTPLVDFYTADFINEQNLGGISTDEYYSPAIDIENTKNLDTLINETLQGNDMPIRGLPIATLDRSGTSNLDVPGWLDPESTKTVDDYKKMGRLPTVLPTDGNLYASGRIISPTIDEIIYALREMISGRPSDTGSNNSDNDFGAPLGTGNRAIDRDTTLREVVDTEFTFKDGKYGSPIDSDNSMKVTKYVNQNDSIVYPVYKALKKVSDITTTFDASTNAARAIKNFTAWEDSKDFNKNLVDNDTANEDTPEWAPRKVPYSLRELEAMIKDNKYNLITLARFIQENFTVSGKLGKVVGKDTDTDKSNHAAGSLYQLHKDYNYDVSNPNTYYNSAGTSTGLNGTTVVGAKAILDDNDIRTSTAIANGTPRYAKDYGTSSALSESIDNYSSSDVYLSASGEWRYVSDHNRIPVLRSEY